MVVTQLADEGVSRALARSTTRRAEAFLLLADVHLDRGRRLARAILRTPTDAQDDCHDAFVRA